MSIVFLDEILSDFLFLALHIGNFGSFPKSLSPEQEHKLITAMMGGDDEARKKLIEHNLRLVAHIIKKYYSSFSEQDDLISIGTIGLIKGINTFNPDKGTRLATYAARCIENEILMHFRLQKKTALEISMSEPIDTDNEGNPLTLSDIIYCEDDIVENLTKRINITKAKQFVSEIPDSRDRAIIIMRYGMDGKEPLTQREVAEKLNISRSYVSRIEKRVLKDLYKKFC